MAKLLCIDTSGPRGVVIIAVDGICLAKEISDAQQQHAGFLHPAVDKVLATSGLSLQQLDAVAVSNGPGSYTGLRIGLSAAKGYCYALNIPLITLSTLAIMAMACKAEVDENILTTVSGLLYCPMIDARRMEVFTALYNEKLDQLAAPHASILDDSFLKDYAGKTIVYCGNGAAKWKSINTSSNALFVEIPDTDNAMCAMAEDAYRHQRFADKAYAEPFYCKAFYTTAKVNIKNT